MSLPPTCPHTSLSVAPKPGNFSPSCTSQPLEQGASAPANTEDIDCLLSTPASALRKHVETKWKVSSSIQMEELYHGRKNLNERATKTYFATWVFAKNAPSFYVKTGDLPCLLLIC